MKKITAEMLRKKKACAEQVEKFAKAFPNGVVPTEELARKWAQEFDWRWAAMRLLSCPAQKACDEATAPAQKAYDEAMATARKAYNEAGARAFVDSWR